MRLPRTKGCVEKLARPAGNVEMLIGMDNQGWMPMHVESSRVENDNLRLMQSVLSPRCILMGSVRMPDQGSGTQGMPPVRLWLARGQAGGGQGLSRGTACGSYDHDAGHAGGVAGVRGIPRL